MDYKYTETSLPETHPQFLAIGRVVGKRTVIAGPYRRDDHASCILYKMQCSCGRVSVVNASSLVGGRSLTCGKSPCWTSASWKMSEAGDKRTRQIWRGMRFRCSSEAKGKDRLNYYERGVRVCARWNVFADFLSDMGPAPAGKTIERIDNKRGYELANCRWATTAEQQKNTRRTKLMTAFGRTMCVEDWRRYAGLTRPRMPRWLEAVGAVSAE